MVPQTISRFLLAAVAAAPVAAQSQCTDCRPSVTSFWNLTLCPCRGTGMTECLTVNGAPTPGGVLRFAPQWGGVRSSHYLVVGGALDYYSHPLLGCAPALGGIPSSQGAVYVRPDIVLSGSGTIDQRVEVPMEPALRGTTLYAQALHLGVPGWNTQFLSTSSVIDFRIE